MFVSTNSIAAVKTYFNEKLAPIFSEREIKLIAQEVIQRRLNLSPADWILKADLRVSESDLLHFRSVVKRLLNNEPFQHILGDTEFYGLSILCSPDALIPRPETEELVDWIVNDFKTRNLTHGLDWCTGTGCIAFALKNSFPRLNMSARDFSRKALELAEKNKQKLQLDVDFHFANALVPDGYQDLKPNSFDFWVSNPPYIPIQEQTNMAPNVVAFEPEMALFVPNEDALLFYREISLQAQEFLKNSGALYFELHENYAQQTKELLENQSCWSSIELKQDLQGKWRMLKAIK